MKIRISVFVLALAAALALPVLAQEAGGEHPGQSDANKLALLLAKHGRHTGLREVRMLRGLTVQIHSTRPIQIHVDGELQTGRNFTIRVLPGALQVMVPQGGDL